MGNAFDKAVFNTNEIVFALGDPGESAFVIEEGCVEILSGLAPDQKRIALLTEGAIFG
ncbi:MAG: cyclic nucleotide-binding domain-containing protein, partial [Candidatus Saccharibacteria bacterium]|nr:cyclic nucleotide-binding domain-containing protein [Rhodoferax sp.]